jgi:hypothetical protein
MFLFMFFLFHDLDLELGMPLFSFWLENLVVLVVFMPLTLYTLYFETSFSHCSNSSYLTKDNHHLKT